MVSEPVSRLLDRSVPDGGKGREGREGKEDRFIRPGSAQGFGKVGIDGCSLPSPLGSLQYQRKTIPPRPPSPSPSPSPPPPDTILCNHNHNDTHDVYAVRSVRVEDSGSNSWPKTTDEPNSHCLPWLAYRWAVRIPMSCREKGREETGWFPAGWLRWQMVLL